MSEERSAGKDAGRRWWQRKPAPSIHDVPCVPCQHGYGGPHGCESPDYCPCERAQAHVIPPEMGAEEKTMPVAAGAQN